MSMDYLCQKSTLLGVQGKYSTAYKHLHSHLLIPVILGLVKSPFNG